MKFLFNLSQISVILAVIDFIWNFLGYLTTPDSIFTEAKIYNIKAKLKFDLVILILCGTFLYTYKGVF